MKNNIAIKFGMILAAVLVVSLFQNCAPSYNPAQYNQKSSSSSTSTTPTPTPSVTPTTGPSPSPSPSPSPVVIAPSITTVPPNMVVTAGQPINVVVAATGTNVTYNWLRNGVAIGDNTNTLAIAAAATGDQGTYTIVVSNSAGTASANFSVTVNAVVVVAPPTITTPPAAVNSEYYSSGAAISFWVVPSASAAPYNQVVFTVAASGQNLSYQWYFVSDTNVVTEIVGANQASYSFFLTALSQVGTYKVVVSNSGGSATASAVLSTTPLIIPVF